jgi:riboflavin synthase
MFTGIIEEVGRVKAVHRGAAYAALTVGAKEILRDVRLGDSITVNGVCLTVTSFSADTFTADVMHETLSRSNLGSLRPGSAVNLERAMAVGGRFGGHIVSGHIDGTGVIAAIRRDDNAVWNCVKTSAKVLRYIIEKGSIAMDGISLTVARIEKDSFFVSVIPHTTEKTILSQKREGDFVNLENDCIGKYIERLMGGKSESMIHPNSFKNLDIKGATP